LAETALAEKEIILFSDQDHDPATPHQMPPHLLVRGYRTGLAIPLIQEQQTFGLIFLWFRTTYRPTASELETFQTFGKTVSLSMANALHVATLTHQANHDPLTGLPNRQALHDYCETALPKAAARIEQTVLCLLDLNRFKEINDTLGHQVGDKALIHVAKCLREPVGECRTTAYRLGGDEFAILIEELPPHGRYLEAAEGLLSAIRKPFELGGIRLEIGGSLGLALFPDHGSDSHELLRCADVAMYCAKADVDPVRVYDDLCDVHTPERLLLMQDLGAAVRDNQLLLHYQPKVNLRTGRVSGCEALLRWHHPRRGLIPPEQFIPLAEMGDLIGPLTDRVLEEALCTLRGWHTRGIPLEMSVNLSTRNLLDRQCPLRLSELLKRYPVAPSTLELEITESALMDSPELALEQARKFTELGIQLSLDDFGTGYSSLVHLKQLQPHVLKIDRTFIRDLLDNETDLIIVRSTIAMAQGLGLTVLAEGVEDQATMDALRELGCDQAQGFHIGLPMTEKEFLAWLGENKLNQS
jgi:diguanylate cyclase (GGDEF)-like protein